MAEKSREISGVLVDMDSWDAALHQTAWPQAVSGQKPRERTEQVREMSSVVVYPDSRPR